MKKLLIGSRVFVTIYASTINIRVVYRGLCTIESICKEPHRITVNTGDRILWAYTNGTDGDIIREPTKLELYLFGA